MGMFLTLYFCTFVLICLYIGLSVCRGGIFRESEAWTTIIFLHEEKWANCLLCIFYFVYFCIFVFFICVCRSGLFRESEAWTIIGFL